MANKRLQSLFQKALKNTKVEKDNDFSRQLDEYVRNHQDERLAQALPVSALPVETYDVPLGIMGAPKAGNAMTPSAAVKDAVKKNNEWVDNFQKVAQDNGKAWAEALGYNWEDLSEGQRAALFDFAINSHAFDNLPKPELNRLSEEYVNSFMDQYNAINGLAPKEISEQEKRKRRWDEGYKYVSDHLPRATGYSEDLVNPDTGLRGEISGRAVPQTEKSSNDVGGWPESDLHRLHMGTEKTLAAIAHNVTSPNNQSFKSSKRLSPQEQLAYQRFYDDLATSIIPTEDGKSRKTGYRGKELYSNIAIDRVHRKNTDPTFDLENSFTTDPLKKESKKVK